MIREVGSDDLRFIFIKDDQSTLVEALYVKGFSEEKYRKLRRYIRERLGEEFTGMINLDPGKALAKVLLVGTDHVGQSLINDVIDNEVSKANSWVSSGIIKELIDKVSSEVKEVKKARRKARKKKRSRKKAKSRRRKRASKS